MAANGYKSILTQSSSAAKYLLSPPDIIFLASKNCRLISYVSMSLYANCSGNLLLSGRNPIHVFVSNKSAYQGVEGGVTNEDIIGVSLTFFFIPS